MINIRMCERLPYDDVYKYPCGLQIAITGEYWMGAYPNLKDAPVFAVSEHCPRHCQLCETLSELGIYNPFSPVYNYSKELNILLTQDH
jgi:hypothetical protein